MRKLIIGFSDGGNTLSALIKLTTKSKISHVFVMLTEDDETVIYQASGLTVNYENYKHFLSHEKIIELYSIDLTDEDYEKLNKFRLQNVGLPYAGRELVGFLWVLFCRQFGKKVNNPLSMGSHAYICVDIAAVHLPIGSTEGTMTPEDLRRWCEKNLKRA